MRAVTVLVMVVLALGFRAVPEPAVAAPCPGHDSVSGGPGHAHHGRQAGTSHCGGREAAAVDDPAGDARGADHGRAAPDGPFCCHAGSAAALVFPPEIASRPGSTTITAVSGRLPPAAPAVGIYRPPAST